MNSYDRLHEPACDLDPSWLEEPVEMAAKRTVLLVHAATVGQRRAPDDRDDSVDHFTAPGFCYVFPLLKKGKSCSSQLMSVQAN